MPTTIKNKNLKPSYMTLRINIQQASYQVIGEPHYDHQKGWQFTPSATTIKDSKGNVVEEPTRKNNILNHVSSETIKNKK
jgi:hypothetical protein